MAAVQPKRGLIAKQMADHGRHIFVYNHLWTGQTVYSLDRTLNSHAAIKQLPFAGKQTVPTTIRKDIWRPLLSVSFPSAPQGRSAFRKLREYRKLHELSWAGPAPKDPTGGLLDLENPYVRHHTARPPKKIRSRMIMDQRANSIADLAAVLREQAATGAAKEKADADRKAAEDQRVREELVQLAEEERNGGLPVLQQAIAAQEAAIGELKAKKAAGEADAPTRRDIHRQILALNALRLKLQKMEAAKEAFEQGHARLVKAAKTASESGSLRGGESQLELDIEPPAIFYHPTSSSTTPKRGSLRKAVAEKVTPVFSVDGVVVKWSNPLDAEFAESWPAAVQHQDAGLLRHAFNKPEDEAIMDVEQITRSRKALEELRMEEEAELDQLDGSLVDTAGSSKTGMAGQPRA